MTAAVAHVLPLANHAQHTVVQDDDFYRQTILQAGRQFLNVHLDAALARYAGDVVIREAQLDAHGRRETEAHGAQATGVDPAVRLVELVVLRSKHLVLAHVGGHKGVAIGHFAQGFDHGLRLDLAAVALVIREQAAITAPLVNLLPPAGNGLLVRGLADFLEDRDHFGQDTLNRTNDRHVGLDGLGDRSRVDVDVNDLGVRAELRCAIDHAIVEACADSQDHVSMVHRQVGGVAAVHAEHADELTIGAWETAQAHQGIGHWQVEHFRQLGQRR
ncbi:hypothetical protein D3C87_1110620 [compost metagenome]